MVTDPYNFAILAIAKVMTYGGLTVAIRQGIAKAGAIFPLFFQYSVGLVCL